MAMADEDDKFSVNGRTTTDFISYEGFLDTLVAPLDLFYLEDHCIARRFVELGYKGDRMGYSREEFEHSKQRLIKQKNLEKKGYNVISAGIDFGDNKMLQLLQMREEANRYGKMCTIVYVRDYDPYGQEISGYIDLAHRLVTDDFTPIFQGEKKLIPRKGDLSIMEWEKFKASRKNSPNYEVLTLSCSNILFRNKMDNKIMNPIGKPIGDNSSRTLCETDDYLHVVFFDHYNRNIFKK